MRILVLSDTHGNTKEYRNIYNDVKGIDLVIHLGDNTKDVEELKNLFEVDIHNVKGNCDYMDNITPDEKVIEVGERKLFLTHGHRYGVKMNLNSIYYRTQELGADIVLFGHSHVPLSIRQDNILFFNPGSISLPRGASDKSYGIIEIDKEIVAKIVSI